MRYSLLLLLLLVVAAGPPRVQAQGQGLCPTFSVTCPDTSDGSTFKFTANISPSAKMTFNWTVSTGTIISGQGTPAISVDTSGFAKQPFTATVEVIGLPKDCPNVASCSTPTICAPPRAAQKFDEYGDLSWAEERARLDKFAAHLKPEIKLTKALPHRSSSHRGVKRKATRRRPLR